MRSIQVIVPSGDIDERRFAIVDPGRDRRGIQSGDLPAFHLPVENLATERVTALLCTADAGSFSGWATADAIAYFDPRGSIM